MLISYKLYFFDVHIYLIFFSYRLFVLTINQGLNLHINETRTREIPHIFINNEREIDQHTQILTSCVSKNITHHSKRYDVWEFN
jgi:hypothetical protein